MHNPAGHIKRFVRLWQILFVAEGLVIALAAGFTVWLLNGNFSLSAGIGLVVTLLCLLWRRPWKITTNRTVEYFDGQIKELEFSAGLVLEPSSSLSSVAQVQQRKVKQILDRTNSLKILPVKPLILILLTGIILVSGAYLIQIKTSGDTTDSAVVPVYIAGDTTAVTDFPEITETQINARYPAYSNIGVVSFKELTIEVLEGTLLEREVTLSAPVDSLFMVSPDGPDREFNLVDESKYMLRWRPDANALYSLYLVKDSLKASTDIHAISLITDSAPAIEPRNIPDFVEFESDSNAEIRVRAAITDDFGLSDVYMVATVSKGAGESVKFREEVLSFPQTVSGKLQIDVARSISLDSIGMEPGDELYYYIEARDNRTPTPRTARSVTFFAVIKDTVENEFMTGGAMAVDLMPDYFRSQRQLIIDTEELIKRRGNLDQQTFRQESNALGYDQKLLRIKYGQYLGDEFESGITESSETLDQAVDSDEEDPTATYTHDHDNESEGANAIQEEGGQEEDSEDPLEKFIHDHSDPEEATLYTQGVRSMLKQAMTEMWDAELYLRLYEPEKSLPFQNNALDLIQKIKNHARIYVHRIGFDPPPIKADSRMSGDLDEIVNPSETRNQEKSDPYASIRKAVRMLNNVKSGINPPENARVTIFKPAGEELAGIALDSPGKYLDLLTALQRLQTGSWENIDWMELAPDLGDKLESVIPIGPVSPGSFPARNWSTLDSMYQVKLERGERD